ncbi:hypothetical protein [Sulfurimonas sp.]|uniref:hypothetical protein n=1 Tax=Sulfurimonas sp. TaxID=2022749 RepID=UPI002B4A7FFE|nr:hypothetical protein [Sulfurimonas sp.]
MPSNIEELKSKVLEAQSNSDIASLYTLEQKASDMFDEDTLGAFYTNILDMALERLTDALESPRVMDMQEVQDFATLRALYEYAMEYYHANNITDASALFEVLSGLSNDKKFSSALKFHWIASKESISLDDFMDNIANIEATQDEGTFYISVFTKEAQKLLDNAQIAGE